MTREPSPSGVGGDGKVAPETLALRARPEPVTRINRRVLIGVAAVLLFFLSVLVLLALKPPSLRLAEGRELIEVEHKPITDALAKLPASYDGVGTLRGADAAPLPPAAPNLGVAQPGLEAVDVLERGVGSRLAGQARESPVLFRLKTQGPGARPEAVSRSRAGVEPDGAGSSSQSTPSAAAQATSEVDAVGTREPTRKLAFLKAEPDRAIYNPHALQRPVSPYQLMAGTVIAASLISGLNSDLPGVVLAQVTEPVYDTVTGRVLLIPQGSRLFGRYDNVVAFGQNRALVVWQRLILPDGSSVVIDNLPATDTGGYAGLADGIDLHTFQLLKGVALATVLGVGSELALGASDNALVKALSQATQQTGNRAGQRLVERDLAVAPTLTVRPGWPLRVIVHKDIILKPYLDPKNP